MLNSSSDEKVLLCGLPSLPCLRNRRPKTEDGDREGLVDIW